MKPQIFISYRRETGRSIARSISDRLTFKGYNVFFDYTSMRNGKFNEQIYDAIERVDDFILILSKDSMDRCANADDWVRGEIQHAITHNKNIILVQDEDFSEFPASFPEELSSIKLIDFTPLSNKYYDAFIDMLETRMLCYKAHTDDNRAKGVIEENSAKKVFYDLAIKLSDMYNIVQQIDIPHIEKGSEIASMSLPLEGNLKTLTLDLINSMESMKEVLSVVQNNNYFLKYYISKLTTINSQCRRISLESGVLFSLESIYDTLAVLDYAIAQLSQMTLLVYINARSITNIADTEAVGMSYDNASVKALFFLGGLILSNVKNDKGLEVINWGAAIIHDLYYLIPSSEELNDIAKQSGLDDTYDNFNVKDYVSYALLNAIEGVDKIGDLYYLKGKR